MCYYTNTRWFSHHSTMGRASYQGCPGCATWEIALWQVLCVAVRRAWWVRAVCWCVCCVLCVDVRGTWCVLRYMVFVVCCCLCMVSVICCVLRCAVCVVCYDAWCVVSDLQCGVYAMYYGLSCGMVIIRVQWGIYRCAMINII